MRRKARQPLLARAIPPRLTPPWILWRLELLRKNVMTPLIQRCFCFVFMIATFLSVPAISLEMIVKHRQGDGVGYKNRYSKIGLYHAFEQKAWQPFIDVRYLLLEKTKSGANLGAGLGYRFAKGNRLFFLWLF